MTCCCNSVVDNEEADLIVSTFAKHDKELLKRQHAIRQDEKVLIQTAQRSCSRTRDAVASRPAPRRPQLRTRDDLLRIFAFGQVPAEPGDRISCNLRPSRDREGTGIVAVF